THAQTLLCPPSIPDVGAVPRPCVGPTFGRLPRGTQHQVRRNAAVCHPGRLGQGVPNGTGVRLEKPGLFTPGVLSRQASPRENRRTFGVGSQSNLRTFGPASLHGRRLVYTR